MKRRVVLELRHLNPWAAQRFPPPFQHLCKQAIRAYSRDNAAFGNSRHASRMACVMDTRRGFASSRTRASTSLPPVLMVMLMLS